METAVIIVICLLIAAIIGFFIGLITGRASNNSGFSSSQKINPVFKKQGNIYNKPLILGIPRPKGKDELQKIEGIDASLEELLNQLGIYHYDQIAKWSDKNAQWVEEYLDIEGQITQENWMGQAKSI